MQNKIRQILSEIGFIESDGEGKKEKKAFKIKDGILTATISEPSSNETINEEIRQTREYLLKHLDARILTLCTIDDTGGILMFGKNKIGEINRIDGVMEINLDKLLNNGLIKA